jgi:hypothetical protein
MELVVTRGPNRLLRARDPREAEELSGVLSEILGSYVVASPSAGRYLLRVIDVSARRTDDLDELAAQLDQDAAWAGGHGFPEEAALLFAASDSIREAGDRLAAVNNPEGGFNA